MSDLQAIVQFYFAGTLILAFTLPLGWVFFRNSSRHLILYTRFLGLLLVNSVILFLSAFGILSFSGPGIFGAMLLLAGIGAFLCWRNNISKDKINAWWRANRKTVIFDEVVFVLALVLFAYLVAQFPKIMDQEKYMDFAFLNSLMRGTDIPPKDPWFSGGTINYYYGGYMIMALLGRLSGLPPAYAYNLSLPFLFAGAVSLSWAFGRQLTGSRRLGALAPLMVAIMGNLNGFLQTLRLGWPYKINYFQSSRIIVDGTSGNTINEFPFFSFFHADLHPHVVGVPFVILFIIVLYEFFLGFRARSVSWNRDTLIASGGRLIIPTLCLFSLGFINGLDLPTFGIFFMGLMFFGIVRAFWGREVMDWLIGVPIACGLILLCLGIAFLVHYPFYGDFVAPTDDSGMLGKSTFKSDVGEFLTVFHLQLFLAVLFLAVHFAEIRNRLSVDPRLFNLSLWGLAAFFVFIFGLLGYFITAFTITIFFVSVYVICNSFRRPNHLFTAVMISLSVAILAGCEFVHIKDAYGTNLQRMNTLFKFHYQAWILFGLSAPVIIQRLERTKVFSGSLKSFFCGIAMVLLAMNLVYPLGVSWGRHKLDVIKNTRIKGEVERLGLGTLREDKLLKALQSLNGMTYLEKDHRADFLGIQWLNDNVEGTPVILEYPGVRAYNYDSRVSANTGLPTLVGWLNHEQIWRKQWVKKDPESIEKLQEAGKLPKDFLKEGKVSEDYSLDRVKIHDLTGLRKSHAEKIYTEPDFEKIASLIKDYQVKYIFVGELERKNYSKEGLEKFKDKTFCDEVFEREKISIYRVRDKYR